MPCWHVFFHCSPPLMVHRWTGGWMFGEVGPTECERSRTRNVMCWPYPNRTLTTLEKRDRKGLNPLEIPFRQLHVAHRASSCAKQGGHAQL